MPNYTENLNLILPKQQEGYNVEVANMNNSIIDANLGNKVDKVVGKGLSANDFTTEYKRKLDMLQNIYKFKGSVNTQAELLNISGSSGDVYNVKSENKDYAWNGTQWVELGSLINIDELLEKDIEQDSKILKIEESIEPLKEYILSDNLFDGKLLTDKTRSITSGALSTFAGYSTPEKLQPVIGGRSIVISIGGVIQSCRVLWYDANEAFISSASSGGQAVELPSTAKYFAFNISSASVTGNIMVNYGTEAMEYQPYVNALEEKISNKVPSFSGDLNTIKTTGFIYALGSATNTPQANISYYITTISLGQNYVIQRANRVVASSKQYYEFERQCYNGTWLDWVQTSGANISTGVEFKTGRIIGGKEEYGKRISFGALPNATTKNIAHGLSNVTIHDMKCEFKSSTAQIVFSSYGVNPTSAKPLIAYVSSTNINIFCEGDSSAYTGYVTLYYTKNS